MRESVRLLLVGTFLGIAAVISGITYLARHTEPAPVVSQATPEERVCNSEYWYYFHACMKESDDSGPAAEKSAAKPVIEPDTPPPTKAEPVKPLANLNDAFKTRQVIVNPSPEISKQTTPKLQEWNRQAPFQRFESIEPLSSSKLYQGRQ